MNKEFIAIKEISSLKLAGIKTTAVVNGKEIPIRTISSYKALVNFFNRVHWEL